jgi:peptidoglycan/LPS O-acetylase OafA/YrhL
MRRTGDSVNKSYRLSDYRGRDNNFNLIRFLAATSVIWTHAFGIQGEVGHEPLNEVFGISAGEIGVNVFFVLSGYLVSKSWTGKSWQEFAWARCMRIFPALWVSTIVLVFLVAAWFTSEPALQFLTSRSTASFVARNVTIIFGSREDLPGAFWNIYPNINQPLWTLPYELHMYIVLAIVGATLGLRPRWVASLTMLGIAMIALEQLSGQRITWLVDNGRFLCFFFSGSLVYVLRERIVLSWSVTVTCVAVVAVSLLSKSFAVREAALAPALVYLLLWCAYVPSGVLRLWNRLGDYSYGMYIFAFPVQVALFSAGLRGVWANFLITMLIALVIAACSWHFLESRALKIKLPLARDVSQNRVMLR